VSVPPGGTGSATPVGFQPAPGTLSGHVFFDPNENGIQDIGEPSLSGQTAIITSVTGGTSATVTDASGNYSSSVPSGTTSTSVVGPTAAVLTTVNNPQTVNVPAGGPAAATAVGFVPPPGTLQGHAFQDTNGITAQDAGEPDLSGLTVTITPSSGSPVLTLTDPAGNYVASVPSGATVTSVAGPAGFSMTTTNNPQTVAVTTGATSAATYRLASGLLRRRAPPHTNPPSLSTRPVF
jgi:hypothetical protein